MVRSHPSAACATRRALSALIVTIAGLAGSVSAKDIIHDAEYYVLEAQHGEKCAVQDSL